jgi:rubrerythrin
MKAEEIINTLTKEEVLQVKEDLIDLHGKEAFAHQLYMGQARKLEGLVVPILNSLAEQEQRHEDILRSTLTRGNITVGQKQEKIPRAKINEPLLTAVTTDITLEDGALKAYALAITKAKSEKIKAILTEIRNEEVMHLKILQDYKKEHPY